MKSLKNISLQTILKGVSRSFYLSLVLLPKAVRGPISLAFLACKAADTIADTRLIPKSERLKLLDAYREMFATQANGFAEEIVRAAKLPHGTRYPMGKMNGKLPPGTRYPMGKTVGGSEAERALIENLPVLMEALSKLDPKDWGLIQGLVLELTQGMQMDLNYFPGETEKELRALQTMGELEQYIYYVAGCVGRFWTKMMKAHFAFAQNFGADAEDCGERLGKGLQLVNVLRDLPRDLRQGRCYIPQELVADIEELLIPANLKKFRPVLLELSQKAKNNLKEHERYCAFFPKRAVRLKTVVKLPALLGFKTLELLENSNDWLNPQITHKVSRGQVYRTLLGSLVA